MSDLNGKNQNFYTEGFPVVNQVKLLQGSYPKTLIRLWNAYKKREGKLIALSA